MNNRFIGLVSVFLFPLVCLVQCKELLTNEDSKALPLPVKPNKAPTKPGKTDDRGWNHWPQWPQQEQSNDWNDNSWPKEPGKLPNLGNHGSEKPCCGKNGWGLPNIGNDPWSDESRPDPLPSSHSEPEPDHEPWMPPDNSIDSNQDDDWHTPNWKPQPEKKPCECDKREITSFDPSAALNVNYPDTPSGVRPNKKNNWGSTWQQWTELDKKLKESVKATAGVAPNDPRVESKAVNSGQFEANKIPAEIPSVNNVQYVADNPTARLSRKRN